MAEMSKSIAGGQVIRLSANDLAKFIFERLLS